jgi:hypothetical protein
MRRFTTEPLTDADLRECYRRLCMSWGKKLILNPETLENFEQLTQQWSVFQRIHLSDIVLGAAGRHISEKI